MDLDTGKWKQAATTGNPPLGVAGYSSAVIENSILYFGGDCYHDNCFHNSVTRLNIDSLEWKELFPTNPHTRPMVKGRCGMIQLKLMKRITYLSLVGTVMVHQPILHYNRMNMKTNMVVFILMSSTILIYQLVSIITPL